MTLMRYGWMAALAVSVVLASGCGEGGGEGAPGGKGSTTKKVEGAMTRPVSGADWVGFGGGGALLNRAEDAVVPPLRVRWTYRTDSAGGEGDAEGGGIEGGAAIVGETVYVADTGAYLHAIDLKTGEARWTFKTPQGFATTPLVMGGRVYIGDVAGQMYALDAGTGEKVWSYDSGATIHASANAATVDGRTLVVFGNDAARIICLDAADGKEVWVKTAGDRVNAAPAIVDGVAVISGCDAKLRAYRLKDGAEVFTADLPALTGGSAAVVGDRMVVGTDQGTVVAMARDGGKVIWRYEDGEESKPMFYGSPAISGDGKVAVIGARDRMVYGFDVETGKVAWRFKTRGDVDSTGVVSGELVYIGSKDKKLYALETATGKKVWEFAAGRAIVSPVAVGKGVVVVGDRAGNVVCLER